jgi:aspartate/glutamate racemase
MNHTLAFLHTSPVHVSTFDALLSELAPDIPVRHVVDESLLSEACSVGEVTPALRKRVEETLLSMEKKGATVVVCTCSTIGAVVEERNGNTSATMLRIDRPMAREAVAHGSRIVVAATLATTLVPTRELIASAARQAHKQVEIIDLLCEKAWSYFEQGNQQAYLQEIAHQVEDAASLGDVIVLAQVSMARASEFYANLPVPVLNSPRSGLLAAIQAYREKHSTGI